jgi:alkanesulfonate monooxygenase SsuD/methylene tetrahydromethanopterin reductase-like flavin-dependent oxidoreductase (luciferase family)
MSNKKPFRFSVQSFNTDSPANWRNLIAKTEALGYSSFHLADHFLSSGPALDSTYHPPQGLAALPAVAMALEQTTTLRVGCRVFCNDYHHPIMLIKEAATMDYLSGGRFEFGLGAGWIKNEYEAINLPFDDFPQRFDRFAETVHAYKAFMSGEPMDIQGETIQWTGFHGIPAPAQSPWPPIMIGGGSKNSHLRRQGSRYSQPELQQPCRHAGARWYEFRARCGNGQKNRLDPRWCGRSL